MLRLDSSDIATILAALRMFQKQYEDCNSIAIAHDWPDHFEIGDEDDEDTVVPAPLGSDDINELCERINCESLGSSEIDLLLEAAEGGRDRIEDTLQNPLELPHYSNEDIAAMRRKSKAITDLLVRLGRIA